jgi:hypothetical protein
MAIACFYSIATLAGAVAPVVFGVIVASGSRGALVAVYFVASAGMLAAAAVATKLAVSAEGRSLEELAA